jgi:amidase
VAACGDTWRNDPEALGPEVQALMAMAEPLTLADHAWAHRVQTGVAQRFAHGLSQCDVIVSPVTPMSPFPWTQPHAEQVDGREMRSDAEWMALTYAVSLATNPAIVLPCGVDARGMPFGLQVIGPLRSDVALLAVAMAMEQAFQAEAVTRRPRPGIEMLRDAPPLRR